MPKPGVDPTSGISSGDGMILPERHPACRRREAQPGVCMEREILLFDAKGEATSGSSREGDSTEAKSRGGAARSRCYEPDEGRRSFPAISFVQVVIGRKGDTGKWIEQPQLLRIGSSAPWS